LRLRERRAALGSGAGLEYVGRQRVVGLAAVAAALEAPAGLRCVVLPSDSPPPEAEALALRAERAHVAVHRVAARRYERLRGARSDAPILALRGPDPGAGLEAVMAQGGAVWLLARPVYPGNVGYAIRTAEVSGADGIAVDCDFDHEKRREAVRAGMRADRFMPVFWESAARVLEAARRAGKRVVAIEDVGRRTPWQIDLTGPRLFVIGAEAEGVPPALLAAADETVRIPMAGFIASYNLQAAMAAVAAERFRQLEAR
jgi:TrmH family RNA methyltransferase